MIMHQSIKSLLWLEIILLLLGVILLSACGSSDPYPGSQVMSDGQTQENQAALADAPVATQTELPELAEPEVIVEAPTHTSVPTQTSMPTITPTATPSLINEIGSPLKMFALEELSGIIYKGVSHDTQISDRGHYGVDFLYYHLDGKGETILGSPITASFPGKVVSVVEYFDDTDLGFPYGNMVIIETPLSEIEPGLLAPAEPPQEGSLYVLYAHMIERPYVEMGDYVLAGQVLGKVGNTGDSDAPHLHWEMRFGPGNAMFGYMTYYNTRATVAQMAAYERWRMTGEFVYFDPMVLVLMENK